MSSKAYAEMLQIAMLHMLVLTAFEPYAPIRLVAFFVLGYICIEIKERRDAKAASSDSDTPQ